MTASPAEPPVALIGGRRVLFSMAAEQEYGPHLRARFSPLMTGVGPVEAGVAVAAALARLATGSGLPDLVVSLGSAGSRRLEQTAVYQVSRISWRDIDASLLGVPKGVTPFLGLPAVLDLPLLVPGIPAASLSTGADIVSGTAYEAIAADMVDMETYASLRACQRFGVPLVGFRGISDGTAELRHVDDWTEYLHVIDERLAAAVDRLETALADGTLAPDF